MLGRLPFQLRRKRLRPVRDDRRGLGCLFDWREMPRVLDDMQLCLRAERLDILVLGNRAEDVLSSGDQEHRRGEMPDCRRRIRPRDQGADLALVDGGGHPQHHLAQSIHHRRIGDREHVGGCPGEDLFADKQPTLMFNGYADQVADLYRGMDLAKFY